MRVRRIPRKARGLNAWRAYSCMRCGNVYLDPAEMRAHHADHRKRDIMLEKLRAEREKLAGNEGL